MDSPPTKRPGLDRARKLEFVFGVAIPGVILGPMLMLGLLGIVVTGASRPMPDASKDVMGILVAMALGGLFALAAIAAAVLLGPDRIKRRPALRVAVVIALLGGIAAAGFALWAQRSSLAWSTSARENFGALFYIVPGLIALGGPVVVALRYLPTLLRD